MATRSARTRQQRRRRERERARRHADRRQPQRAQAAPTDSRRRPLRRLAEAYGLDGAREYGSGAWLLAIGTAASLVGRGVAIPFVVVYLNLVQGVITLPQAAAGVFVEQTLRALLSPLFGGLSDRYGRKPFMVIGLTLQSLTLPAYALVTGPATYFGVAALAGLGQAPYQPALGAYLAETVPGARRVGVFGLVHMAKNLGFSVGVVLGSLLVQQGYPVLFFTGGFFPLAYALLVLLLLDEPSRSATGPRTHPLVAAVGAFRNRRFLAFLAVALVTFVSWGQLQWVLPLFIKDPRGLGLDEAWVSRAFLLNSLLVVALQVPVSERVAARVPRTRGLAAASLVTTIACIGLAASAALATTHPTLAPAALLAATAILTLAEMFDTPLLFSLAADLAPPSMTGGAMGVLGLAAPAGMAAPLLLAGLIGENLGWTTTWLVSGALLALGAAGYVLLGETGAHAAPTPQATTA